LIKLYDNPFSPFARKVRMVLQFKDVAFQAIDALAVHERERLLMVNPRVHPLPESSECAVGAAAHGPPW
jgi:glutathione S-transferase